MSVYDPRQNRSKKSSARARQAARQLRRKDGESHSRQSRARGDSPLDDTQAVPQGKSAEWVKLIRHKVRLLIEDGLWYLRNNPVIPLAGFLVVLGVVFLYFLSFFFSGNIFPRVRSMGINLGGMSLAEAESVLRKAWYDGYELALYAEGEVVTTIRPDLLGITFNVEQTAQNAKKVKFSAFPFGETIEPVIAIDRLTAQNYLLELADRVDTRPSSAGYTWENGQLIGVEGAPGRILDITLTIEQLIQEGSNILNRGRLDLLLIPLPPEASDPAPYIEQARLLLNQPIQVTGYDPYKNQFYTWPIAIEDFTRWLAVGATSLTLREETFLPFLDAINSTLAAEGDEEQRYIAQTETTNTLREAIQNGKSEIYLRIRYYPTTYSIVAGDTSFKISRKTGIPRFLIVEANRGRNLELLSIGDEINIPSRDETMLEPPIPHKRIVVDLETQYLVAFENSQVIFEWPISSGVASAYTAPGVYQILSHKEQAYGSSGTLCDNVTLQCGQWEMNWFMGIYEVQPGFVNGFHGKVLLPNGNWLGDGMIGQQATFGCIMSSEEEAILLYDWAGIGTVVEILSDEYPPMSDLGQLGLEIARTRARESNNA